ncbi:hypothetical protein L1049_004322 [Liquidambar formosana]|uniref:Uncharacterized protein n=1 Tax=Liquidambar formosana TaxID=63359 RepID=A0AAP0RT54_LIQFO
MGFLDKLWDETLAGPAPDTGLGKLRKYHSFSAVRSPPPIAPNVNVPISRTITLLKTNSSAFRNFSADSGSDPASPAGSTTPRSPFTPGTPHGHFKRSTRKKEEAYEEVADPTSPTVYDWFSLFSFTSLILIVNFITSLPIWDFPCKSATTKGIADLIIIIDMSILFLTICSPLLIQYIDPVH